MISTGTDVKPIECVFFLRNVKSAGFFEQMKGRGVRVISPDKLKVVTPSAKAKDASSSWMPWASASRTRPIPHAQPQALRHAAELLEYVAQGGTDPDALTTLAGRLARLQREFTADQLAELRELAGGKSFPDLAHDLLSLDPDAQIAAAKHAARRRGEPTEEQMKTAAEQLAQQAVTPFLKAAFRRRILEIRAQNEQTIDRHTIDDVLYAGFDAAAVEKAQAKVKDFRAWIAAAQGRTDRAAGPLCRHAPAETLAEGPAPIERRALHPAARRHAHAALARLSGGGRRTRSRARAARSLPTSSPSCATRSFRRLHARALSRRKCGHAIDAWLAGARRGEDLHARATRMARPHGRAHRHQPRHRAGRLRGWLVRPARQPRQGHALFGDKLKPLMAELNERLAA